MQPNQQQNPYAMQQQKQQPPHANNFVAPSFQGQIGPTSASNNINPMNHFLNSPQFYPNNPSGVPSYDRQPHFQPQQQQMNHQTAGSGQTKRSVYHFSSAPMVMNKYKAPINREMDGVEVDQFHRNQVPRDDGRQDVPSRGLMFSSDPYQRSSQNSQNLHGKGAQQRVYNRKVQQSNPPSDNLSSASGLSGFSSSNYGQQQLSPGQCSPYSQYYPNLVVSLYFGKGDGEIFLVHDKDTDKNKMVTCIDISTLYQEKRGGAIQMIQTLQNFKHKHLVPIDHYWIVPNYLLFVEMEAPDPISQWKTFCKQNMSYDETLDMLQQVISALSFLHSHNYIHRDVHPSRIQKFEGGIVKFNTVGLPYNFKKLLRRSDFSGHVNYSAPELILEKSSFSNKIDIWALGCCIYYIFNKRDPFEGKDPQVIKQKILNFNMNEHGHVDDGMDSQRTAIKQLITACLNFQDMIRPSCNQLLLTIEKARQQSGTIPDAKEFSCASDRSQGMYRGDRSSNNLESSGMQVANEKSLESPGESVTPTPNCVASLNHYNNIQKVFSSKNYLHQQKAKQLENPANLTHSSRLVASLGKEDLTNKSPEQQPATDSILSEEKQEKEAQQLAFQKYQHGKVAQNWNSIFLNTVEEEDQLLPEQVKTEKQKDKVAAKLCDLEEYKDTKELLAELGVSGESQLKATNETVGASPQHPIPISQVGAQVGGTNMTTDPSTDDRLETKAPIQKKDILFDGGSVVYVVPEIPNVVSGDVVSEQIHERRMEKSATQPGMDEKLSNMNNKFETHPELMQRDFTLTFQQVYAEAMKSPHYMKIIEDKGRTYEGEVRNNAKHGIGVMQNEDGEIYEGQWVNSQKCGFGKYTYSNGDVYTGNFSSDKPNGHGKMLFALTGNIYEGFWKDGKATGQGILNLVSEQKVQKGEFYDCVLHGFGQLTSHNVRYIGQFRDGDCDGFGKLEYLDQMLRYVGMFKQDKKEGQGVLMDQRNGILFQGTFKQDNKHGRGKQINFAANQSILGVWAADTLNFVESFGQINQADIDLKTNLEEDSIIANEQFSMNFSSGYLKP